MDDVARLDHLNMGKVAQIHLCTQTRFRHPVFRGESPTKPMRSGFCWLSANRQPDLSSAINVTRRSHFVTLQNSS
jgi:hypothetical protein